MRCWRTTRSEQPRSWTDDTPAACSCGATSIGTAMRASDSVMAQRRLDAKASQPCAGCVAPGNLHADAGRGALHLSWHPPQVYGLTGPGRHGGHNLSRNAGQGFRFANAPHMHVVAAVFTSSGGQATSGAKWDSARENGRKGGCPRKATKLPLEDG